MTDLQQIKRRIFKEERIEELLELLECDFIDAEQGGMLFTASLPDGDNRRSVQIKNNENLGSSIRSRNIEGDIYSIVSYIIYDAKTEEDLNSTLPRSKYWLCDKMNYLEYVDDFYKETSGNIEVPKINYNRWLNNLKRTASNEIVCNKVIEESILEKYGRLPNYGWLQEGISYGTQSHFGVGFDVRSERITFPIHNMYGELVGVKGRYCGQNQEIEDSFKYLYLEPCNKSLEFFNLHRALPYINEYKEVIVVEGAKTVMLMHSWGYKNVISIEGDSLSNVQIRLLKSLGISISLIFAWDKDKDAEYVKNEVQRVQGRLRFAVLDVDNLLNEKDSPVDQGKEIWNKLYKENLYKIR